MSVIQVIVKNTNKHVCVMAFVYVCENTYLMFFSPLFNVLLVCEIFSFLFFVPPCLLPPVHNPGNQSQCTVLKDVPIPPIDLTER